MSLPISTLVRKPVLADDLPRALVAGGPVPAEGASVSFTPFPHGTGSLSVSQEYLALEDGPPIFRQGFTCLALLVIIMCALSCTGISPSTFALPRAFH